MKNTFLKNCLALFIITLVAGVVLASVNEITKEPIAAAEENARLSAYETVYPDVEFKAIENSDDLLNKSADILKQANLSQCTIDDVLLAADKSEKTVGYIIAATSPSGYGGDIQIAIGISKADNEITGFTVLSNSETAGLGAKITEDEFISQFSGKSANGIQYTKNGASADNEIDAISGATISTNAVTEAVNSALAFYNSELKEADF